MPPSTWVIIGASRGIGLELVRQLLERGDQVIAAVRNIETANQIWQLSAQQTRPGSCLIDQCDVTSEASIDVSNRPCQSRHSRVQIAKIRLPRYGRSCLIKMTGIHH